MQKLFEKGSGKKPQESEPQYQEPDFTGEPLDIQPWPAETLESFLDRACEAIILGGWKQPVTMKWNGVFEVRIPKNVSYVEGGESGWCTKILEEFEK
jgi:hypothetical protein